MKKNVASQKIGCQMVSATDGSAFTSAVTVYVTGDAGTQSAGSVGSGACTHEGNGYHTYAPSQAETNYDLVAFTFVGTGAVPATVQVYTHFPQTGDAFDRLGAPAGASVSADIATIDSNVDAILVDTGTTLQAELDGIQADTEDIQTRLPAALTADGNIKADTLRVGGTLQTAGDIPAMITAVDDYIDTEVAAIKAKTDNLPASPAATGDIPSAASIADAVWDEATTGHVSAGTFGEQCKTDIDAILEDTGTTLQAEVDGIQADTEDIQSKIGTPAGVSVSADIAAVKSETAAILVDTGTTLDGKIDTIDTNVDSILADTGTDGVQIAAGELAVKKNTALSNFEFVMTDSTTHAPKTGVAVTAQRSIDGAAFGACANAVSEISNGLYKIDLAAADLNGNVITLRFTGAASDDLLITIITQA